MHLPRILQLLLLQFALVPLVRADPPQLETTQPGQQCPENFEPPTLEFCIAYADSQNLDFFNKDAPPISIESMCVHRIRPGAGLFTDEDKEEYAASYLPDQFCPDYQGVIKCVCISKDYTYSPPPPYAPGTQSPPTPAPQKNCKGPACKFELSIGPCITDSDAGGPCQELVTDTCLILSSLEGFKETWFFASIKASPF